MSLYEEIDRDLHSAEDALKDAMENLKVAKVAIEEAAMQLDFMKEDVKSLRNTGKEV